ncbi:MAG: PLP-dependent aminotransferase family protein [bacterium]|nr:PLP-dependent aminotransferase family protein [bacterium]
MTNRIGSGGIVTPDSAEHDAAPRAQHKLQKLWRDIDTGEVANTLLRPQLANEGEWDPPEGVVPKRPLLYLSIGIPDGQALPREALHDALEKVFAHPSDAAFRYGYGDVRTREYLAESYSRQRGVEVTKDWFQMTNGASGAIDVVVRSLIDPGDVIIVESPTYMGTLKNFRGVGADIRSVPMDEQGLNTEQLAGAVKAIESEGKRVKLVYTISAFHNPCGVCLSSTRQRELLDIAAEHGFLILDDIAYGDLYYGSSAPPAMAEASDGYGVITVGSFSKILATGLRIGWVHARPELIALFSRMRFDMGQSQLSHYMMGHFLAAGELERHADRMRKLYREKMTVTAEALEKYAGDHLCFERPMGGYYIWVELREGLSAKAVWRTAMHEGVGLSPGHRFFPADAEATDKHLRFAFCYPPMDQLEEAARRIGIACERVASGDVA